MNITAILCVHDDLTWFSQALSSVASQTNAVQEILVVKSEQTPPQVDEIARPYGSKIVVQQTPGLAGARNHGIALAQGDLLVFLDSDDLWETDKTSVQLTHLTAENLDAVTGMLYRFSDAEAGVGQYAADHFNEAVPALTPGGLMVKKRLFETIGLFDTRYRIACDHEWFMRLTASAAKWKKTNHPVLRKRIHQGNLSNRIAEYRREIMNILKERQS